MLTVELRQSDPIHAVAIDLLGHRRSGFHGQVPTAPNIASMDRHGSHAQSAPNSRRRRFRHPKHGRGLSRKRTAQTKPQAMRPTWVRRESVLR